MTTEHPRPATLFGEHILICAWCHSALDAVVSPTGVQWRHPAHATDDHEPLPIPPSPDWRGHCDFCAAPGAEFRLPVRDFTVPDNPGARSRGGWSACGTCAHHITHQRWEAVLARAVRAVVAELPSGMTPTSQLSLRAALATQMRALHAAVRGNITGPLAPVRGDHAAITAWIGYWGQRVPRQQTPLQRCGPPMSYDQAQAWLVDQMLRHLVIWVREARCDPSLYATALWELRVSDSPGRFTLRFPGMPWRSAPPRSPAPPHRKSLSAPRNRHVPAATITPRYVASHRRGRPSASAG